MKYRKRPVMIEAWRVPENIDHTAEMPPVWLVAAIMKGTVVADSGTRHVTIKTLEGEMVGNPGDWIIQGVKGELYPCKPDIFSATYESASVGDA